jgi:hypothetical protein
MVKAPSHTACASEQRSNNSMQRTALRAAADAEHSIYYGVTCGGTIEAAEFPSKNVVVVKVP